MVKTFGSWVRVVCKRDQTRLPEKKISEQRYEASEKMNNDFFLGIYQ